MPVQEATRLVDVELAGTAEHGPALPQYASGLRIQVLVSSQNISQHLAFDCPESDLAR
jgi:hypothetical protein